MQYRILDAHCDTITELSSRGGTLYQNHLHLDYQRMRHYAAYLQFFAAWIDDSSLNPFQDCMALINSYHSALAQTPELRPVFTAEDAQAVFEDGAVGAMLTVENGHALEGKPERLKTLWEHGVRAMTITWNGQNALCMGSMAGQEGGLTALGRETVAEMNRLGMLVDISHASEQGFWDILETSTQPVFASHSNSFAICAHPRNLKDEQIRALAVQGGVMGLNLYPEFLSQNQADLTDCVAHLRHTMNIGGEDCVGLGSDFDGVTALPQEMSGVEDYDLLFNRLEESGFTATQIDKITHQNFLNYLKRTLPKSEKI